MNFHAASSFSRISQKKKRHQDVDRPEGLELRRVARDRPRHLERQGAHLRDGVPGTDPAANVGGAASRAGVRCD